MPQTGHRIVFTGPGVAEVEEFVLPEPGPQQALVRTEHTLISAGTEITRYLGELPTHPGYPVYPGYSNVGVVEAVGPGVERPAVGERILTLSQHTSHFLLDLSPERLTYWETVPAAVDPEQATFAVLGSVSMHAVRRANLQLGEAVAVFGAGVVGQLIVQMARSSGARPVIAVDLLDDRLELARRSGADATVSPGREDVVEAIVRLTGGRGADALFDATRTSATIPTMMKAAAQNGRLLIVGSLPDKVEIDPFTELQRRELSIIGCFQPASPVVGHAYFPWTQRRNRALFLDLLRDGSVRVDHLITHRLPYDAAPKAYATLRRGRAGWLGVVLEWG
ncbi:MAG: zinc-binding dehydrogenase [Anaerolineae bacterium]|nr:zinc-binding dehydrogenase [Anaerolineae bacterium]